MALQIEKNNCCYLVLVLSVLLVFMTDRSTAAPGQIVVTSDTEAHLQPCQTCPGQEGQGGLARRSTRISQLRKSSGPLLLLDAGNVLFGGPLPVDSSTLTVKAYNQMKYDAVNISYRDFREGKKKTIELLKKAKFTPISANIRDKKTGNHLFQSHKIIETSGVKYGVVGITEKPLLDALPHLRDQLNGISISDPISTLKQLLPDIQKKADRIILLYYGSTYGLVKLHQKMKKKVDLYLAGGIETSNSLARKSKIQFVSAPRHGAGMGSIPLPGKKASFDQKKITSIPIKNTLTPEPEIARLIDPIIQKETEERENITGNKTSDHLSPTPEIGKQYTLYKSGMNRGLRITVRSLRLVSSVAGIEASRGKRLLIVKTGFLNRTPLELLESGIKSIKPQVGVLGLSKRCFLTLNKTRLIRLHPKFSEVPGALPESFVLKQPGSYGKGSLLFSIPDENIHSLTLHLFHDQFGFVRVPIKRSKKNRKKDRPERTGDWQENSVARLAPFGHRTTTSYLGQQAPPGQTFLVVQLGGMSRLWVKTEAAALTSGLGSKKKKMVKLKKPIPHAYAPQMFQAVVDGEYTYLPRWQMGTFPETPVFLPDHLTIGELVYLIPKKRNQLSLRLLFPTLKLPGRRGGKKKLTDLKHLRVDLEGTYNKPDQRKALGAIKDRPIAVGIMDKQLATSYLGKKAEAEKQFLILTVTLKHVGDGKGGIYTFEERLFVKPEGDSKRSPHPLSYRTGSPTTEKFYVPSNKRQTFDLVFEVPKSSQSAHVIYQGIKEFGKLKLNLK